MECCVDITQILSGLLLRGVKEELFVCLLEHFTVSVRGFSLVLEEGPKQRIRINKHYCSWTVSVNTAVLLSILWAEVLWGSLQTQGGIYLYTRADLHSVLPL